MNTQRLKNLQFSQGFTLIELLVVIAVISLLASVVLVALNSSRIKARDTKRKADLRQMASALELYYNQNNSYPSTSSILYSSEPSDNWSNGPGDDGDWVPGLAPAYVSKLPREPLGGDSTNPACTPYAGRKRAYLYISDGTGYLFLAHCSPEGQMSATDQFYDPVRPTFAWRICAGAYC